MLIYICCFHGVSSCYFCKSLQKQDEKDVYIDTIQNIIHKYDELNETYTYLIAYGELTYLNEHENEMDKIQQILICPQARYLLASYKELVMPYDVPISSIAIEMFMHPNREEKLASIIKASAVISGL